MSLQTVSFLLVEDDELDVEAFRRLIRKQRFDAHLEIATDGAEAIRALQESARSAANNQPIVCLDMNMPGMNGHEFLKELRADAELRSTIVFVLTSSDHERDIRMAYDQNVAGYFLKSEIDSFITTISHYVEAVKYPCRSA